MTIYAKNKELLRRIYKLRSEGTWEHVKQKVYEEFGYNIPVGTLRNLHDKYVAHSQMISEARKEQEKEASEVNIDWNKRLMEKFNNIDETLTKQLEDINQMVSEAKEAGDSKTYMKLIDQQVTLSKEILNQLHFIRKLQENIYEKKKDAVMTSLQVQDMVNKQLNDLEEQGIIKINTDKYIKMGSDGTIGQDVQNDTYDETYA